MASADWMRRNLLKRLEIMFPVLDGNFKKRLIEVMNVYFADNVKARKLLPRRHATRRWNATGRGFVPRRSSIRTRLTPHIWPSKRPYSSGR